MIQEQEAKPVKVHYNIPQILFALVRAAINILIWGRATGKTEGPMAMFSLENVLAMPRSTGVIVGKSYEQILTKTLPGLVKGWENLGYFENTHYWIRKFPPASLRVPGAFKRPFKADHYITWFNGSGIHLVSMDRPETGNGLSVDWMAGDEAKTYNYERLKELFPAIRGNKQHFGHLSNHGSILFTTDRPSTSKGQWLLNYAKEMDKEVIDGILLAQCEIIKLQAQLEDPDLSPYKIGQTHKQIKKLQDIVNELRKNTVYFSLASTFDNVDALGIDAIKNMRRNLTDFDFDLSVLNKEMFRVEGGFYALFDEDKHTYSPSNFNKIDQINNYRSFIKDCTYDEDFDSSLPLDISMDHGASINLVVTGQYQHASNEYRFLSGFRVLKPGLTRDVVAIWCAYYKKYPTRKVRYYYDHTSTGHDGKTIESYAEEVVRILRDNDWEVEEIHIGQQPEHTLRYRFWGRAFPEDNNDIPKFRWNDVNCKDVIAAIGQVDLDQSGGEFKKSKKTERDPNFDQTHAPHYTDACDNLAIFHKKYNFISSGEWM